jgi:hypothetical protein
MVLVRLQGAGWGKEGDEGSKDNAEGDKESKEMQESGSEVEKQEEAPKGTHATVLKVSHPSICPVLLLLHTAHCQSDAVVHQ